MKKLFQKIFGREQATEPEPAAESGAEASALLTDLKLKMLDYTVRGLQAAIGLLQSRYEQTRQDGIDAVAALVLKCGGEVVLETDFVKTVQEQDMVLLVERVDEAGTAVRYRVVHESQLPSEGEPAEGGCSGEGCPCDGGQGGD